MLITVHTVFKKNGVYSYQFAQCPFENEQVSLAKVGEI